MNISKRILFLMMSYSLTSTLIFPTTQLDKKVINLLTKQGLSVDLLNNIDEDYQLLFVPAINLSKEEKKDLQEFSAVLNLPYQPLGKGQNRSYCYNEALKRYISTDRNTEVLEQFKTFKAIKQHYAALDDAMQKSIDLN